jgi:hypothetical protein
MSSLQAFVSTSAATSAGRQLRIFFRMDVMDAPEDGPASLTTQGRSNFRAPERKESEMIRKLKSGEYRLYSRKKNPKTGKRRNLGTFKTRAAAEKHEKAVQFFKRQ